MNKGEPKKVVFLDRDGPINIDFGYVHEIEKWQWSPGAIEGLKLLQDKGFALTLITSQSGIGHGMYVEADMHKLHDYMKAELQKHGVTIAGIAFCPHERDQDDCDCRKPKIGMAKQLEEQLGPIDYAHSWTIGDKEADVGFGKNAGTKTALMRSRYWEEDQMRKWQPDLIVDSLLEFAQQIG